MDAAAPDLARPAPDAGRAGRAAPLVVGGIASLGAGAVHAAAIGGHDEHRGAVLAFTLVAAAQLVWGAVALVRGGRAVALTGIALAAAVLVAWARAKTGGIGVVEGLEAAEEVRAADAIAAAMAGLVAISSARSLVTAALGPPTRRSGIVVPAGTVHAITAIAVATFAVAGMASAGSPAHAHGDEPSTSAPQHAR